jgi:hypothetical protein
MSNRDRQAIIIMRKKLCKNMKTRTRQKQGHKDIDQEKQGRCNSIGKITKEGKKDTDRG